MTLAFPKTQASRLSHSAESSAFGVECCRVPEPSGSSSKTPLQREGGGEDRRFSLPSLSEEIEVVSLQLLARLG